MEIIKSPLYDPQVISVMDIVTSKVASIGKVDTTEKKELLTRISKALEDPTYDQSDDPGAIPDKPPDTKWPDTFNFLYEGARDQGVDQLLEGGQKVIKSLQKELARQAEKLISKQFSAELQKGVMTILARNLVKGYLAKLASLALRGVLIGTYIFDIGTALLSIASLIFDKIDPRGYNNLLDKHMVEQFTDAVRTAYLTEIVREIAIPGYPVPVEVDPLQYAIADDDEKLRLEEEINSYAHYMTSLIGMPNADGEIITKDETLQKSVIPQSRLEWNALFSSTIPEIETAVTITAKNIDTTVVDDSISLPAIVGLFALAVFVYQQA